MLQRTDSGVEPGRSVARRPLRRKRLGFQGRTGKVVETPLVATVFGRPPAGDRLPGLPLRPLIAEYTATFGSAWAPVTRRKHRDDFARFTDWLETRELPVTTGSLDFATLVEYVSDLRVRPKVSGVWRGAPDALARSLTIGPAQTLSANSVNAYVRPLRSLAIWLVDDGLLSVNPFQRSRRRASLNPLLPSEETPTKSATLDDLRALERGCAGDGPLDLRDAAIVSILVTTAARNSSVRLLRLGDVDFERSVIRFRRAKGGKSLELALHAETRAALLAYLERGRAAFLPPSPAGSDTIGDPGWLFLSHAGGMPRPLTMNSVSLMLTRRYHAGGGSLRCFGGQVPGRV